MTGQEERMVFEVG